MKALLAAAALASLVAVPLVGRAEQPACGLERLDVIHAGINGDGTVLVPVIFEGHETWMTLNMASGASSLFPAALQELGLIGRTHKPERDFDAGGVKIDREVTARSVVVGGANFTGWNLLVLPGSQTALVRLNGRPIVGNLSSAFMNVVDVELNLGAGEISLYRHKKCQGPPPHWEGEFTGVPLFVDDAGLLIFVMELDGQKVEASLNTQTGQSVLSSEVTRRYFGFDETSPGVTHESIDAGQERASFQAMSLTAKGLNIRNTPVRLVKSKCRPDRSSRKSGGIGYRYCFNVTPLKIGTDLLKQLRVYMASDPSESMVYFMRATPAIDPAVAPETAR